MGRESDFHHEQDVQLLLTDASNGEKDDTLTKKGLQIGIDMLHDPILMINYDNKSISHESIEPTHPKAVDVHKLASQFQVPLLAADDLKSPSGQWKHFEVRETVPLVMGMTKKIVFYTALRYNDDGMEALSDPGSDMTIYGKYTLSASETDHRYLQLSEVTYMHFDKVLSLSTLLRSTITSTMVQAHKQVNAYYRERHWEAMKSQKST